MEQEPKNNNGWVEQKSANYWQPEKQGDILEGVIIGSEAGGRFGKQLVIQTAQGDEVRTPCHKVLQAKIKSVMDGELIRIVYDGEELPHVKGNKPTRLYSVFIKNNTIPEVVTQKVE